MSNEKKPQPEAGIQRYDVDAGRLADEYWEDILQVSAEGPWVRYSDHEATIDALRAERDEAQELAEYWKTNHDREAERADANVRHASTLSARVAQLEAALEPFAAWVQRMDESPYPHGLSDWSDDMETATVSLGHFRRARALLSDGGADV